MYTTVIVPLDGSELAEDALAPAAEVARETGATLTPLMAVADEAFERHERYLERAVEGIEAAIGTPLVVPDSDAAEAIANAGEAEGSLVVMTTHGSSGVRRAVLGSVAERALRLLGNPMLLVGPAYQGEHALRGGRMLLPIDGSEPAETILAPAARWCTTFAMEPWVVTVEDPEAATATETSHGDIVEAATARRVADDLGKLGVQAQWEVLHGRHPDGPIVTYALDLPAALIAMSTHGRTGLARITVGSTAARVLHEAPCPVLVQRPDNLAAD